MLGKIFEEQVRLHAARTAIKTPEEMYTYGEINFAANQVAHLLSDTSGKANSSVIALLFQHGAQMIIGTLGAVKAGKTYVPLDPSFPEERIGYILEDSGATVILTNEENLALALTLKASGRVREVLNISKLEGLNGENLNIEVDGKSPAYILYTSGSTGRPKGVVQSHENVHYFITNYIKRFSITPEDCLTLFSAFSHDAAVMDIYSALFSGAALYPLNIKAVDFSKLASWLKQEKITIYHSVPTVYRFFVRALGKEEFPDLRLIILGGEAVIEHDVFAFQQAFQPHTALVNLYGQSESSFNSAQFFYQDSPFKVTLGEPILGTKFLVIDDEGQEVTGLGVGEIVVASSHIALGYWRDDLKTEKAFSVDPELGRLYWTGDLARLDFDGSIEFMGRKDFQVKIRGYRIELGEIESQLLRHEAIEDVAVILKESPDGNNFLCAFLVAKAEIPAASLRTFLLKTLPDYMVPARYNFLTRLPLTPNNKLDRKALQDIPLDGLREEEYIAPTTETEVVLTEIWARVLRVAQVGCADNFFALGGNSLFATQVVSSIFQRLNVEVPLRVIFQLPTVGELAGYIEQAEKQVYREIARATEAEYYPVSSAQKRQYVLYQLNTHSLNYNMPFFRVLKGDVQIGRLETALKALIHRQEALRTSFTVIDGQIMQKIHTDVEFAISHWQGEESELPQLMENFIQPFDLSTAPLLRVGLVQFVDKYLLMMDTHHIIQDGFSRDIFFSELLKLYAGEELPPLKIQYKDYSVWQNNFLKSAEMQKQEDYWLEVFTGELPVLNLPIDYPRPAVMSFDGMRTGFLVDKAVTEELNKLAKQNGATLFMVMLAAYNVLLMKYSGQEDIVVGSPIAGRPHVDLERIIGMFANTLALRNKPAGEKTFREFLAEVREHALKAYENQDYQFEMLVDKLNLARDISRNPLFDTVFVLQNMGTTVDDVPEMDFIPYQYDFKIAKFDLRLAAYEHSGGIGLDLEFNTRLFTRETAEAMARHYLNILRAITENPETKLAAIAMLTASEKEEILYNFNARLKDYPAKKTIQQLFKEAAVKHPTRVAASLGREELTYGELYHKANQFALLLKSKGVGKDQIVALLADRSLEVLVAIFGILQAGGAYLPIDPEYPEDRINYILKNSGTSILLTESKNRPKLLGFAGEVLDLQEMKNMLQEGPELTLNGSPADLAYVIYTSGSTGLPKGVMIEQRGLVNYAYWAAETYVQGEECAFPLYSSLAFDLTVTSIFVPLITGNRIRIYPDGEKEVLIKQVLVDNAVQIIKLTPAHLQILKELDCSKSTLKRLIVGGEDLKSELALEIHQKFAGRVEIYNEYGPTETVVGCMIYRYDPTKDIRASVPIGVPAANVQIYLLDQYGEPVPAGAAGEMYISGDGVARGYLHREDLTAERFVANPFIPGQRMYKTGDLARRLRTGLIEFIGRIDNQVKIRGYRIELGEIEHQLLTHPEVEEAAVIDRADASGDKYLLAYFAGPADPTSVKEYLQKSLPEYMVPAFIVQMERLPLTPNGKVDRKALPEPEKTALSETAPRNAIEAKLLEVWKMVLDRENIGIYDNFFELGGHSLKATQLAAYIFREMDVELQLMDIFTESTIAALAALIQSRSAGGYAEIAPVELREYYPVSSAQKRLYVLYQLDKESLSYNVPFMLSIEGRLDVQRLETAVQALIARHEALRTAFVIKDDEPVQIIHPAVEFTLAQRKACEEEMPLVIKSFIKPFDFAKAPLLRVELVELAGKYVLMIDMHHIISDGISREIFFKELAKLYAEGPECALPSLRIQYKDFAIWQNAFLKSEKMIAEENYWLNLFAGEIPVLNLPTDFPRPAVMSFEGDRIQFYLPKELANKLNRLATEEGATMFMVLFAAYNLLLARYSGQEDIITGTPIAGRPHADLENILGMFVNTLALRCQPAGAKTVRGYLGEVKTQALLAYDNQDYQFETLVDQLHLERDVSRNPLFDTVFTLQNLNLTSISLQDITLAPYPYEVKNAKFDLRLACTETTEGIGCDLEYNTRLFTQATAAQLAQHFQNLLQAMVTSPEARLAELEMLSPAECENILAFNATSAAYPREKTVIQLFLDQVAKTPEKTALSAEGRELTYQELFERASQLAATLQAHGTVKDEIIGLLAERSIETVAAIWGVLLAGCAYLPIDPEYPAGRVEYILKDSEMRILLTQSDYLGKFAPGGEIAFTGKVLDINDSSLYGGAISVNQGSPHDLAYVIYTSGSTGRPKGVLVEHQGLVNYLTWASKAYIQGEECAMPLYSSLSFDLTVTSLYLPLITGGKVVIYGREEKELLIAKILREDQVQVVKLTPAHLQIITGLSVENSHLKRFIVGGEDLKTDLAKAIHDKFYGQIEIYNEYGPTETVVGCMIHRFDPRADRRNSVPIGVPADNVQIHLLDRYQKPVPRGVVGEVYIAGDGVARGYLHQAELTHDKFIVNPFQPTERMYRTGDLARRLPDGLLEFLGRVDSQVKIRGYRIELGEIERQIAAINGVKEVLVIDYRDNSGDVSLRAYYTSEGDISPAELKAALAEKLPEYMLPALFIALAEFPLTVNGKIDRKALPDPEMQGGAVKPRNGVEAELLLIWQEVLDRSDFGVTDNFFELGGHSLKATKLLARIFKTLDVELSLMEVFERPTIVELAEVISTAKGGSYASIEPAPLKAYYPVSSAQQRMFILNRLDEESMSYNMPFVITIESELDPVRFEWALQEIIRRHEALRTSFAIVDGEIVQKIHPDIEFTVEYREDNTQDLATLMKNFIRPFDLGTAPLVRAALIKNAEGHLFMLDKHHIISDGISTDIIFEELIRLYHGESLPKPGIQYKDFALWQNQLFTTEKLQKQDEYWLSVFQGEIPAIDLPLDFARRAVPNQAGALHRFKAGPSLKASLTRLAEDNDATMFMVLLAVYNVLLAKYCGQEDLIIGTPIAGRNHPDLERVVGMFVNTLAMRNYPEARKTFREFLLEVREHALQAYANQDTQFETLLEKLKLQRDLGRNPLFDVLFDLHTTETQQMDYGLKVKRHSATGGVAKFDLSFEGVETVDELYLSLEYATGLFRQETVERMAGHLLNIMAEVSANPNIALAEIDILTPAEKTRLIYEFAGPTVEIPRDMEIHQFIERQAELHPTRPALKYQESTITYAELNRRSNQLARVLKKRGVAADKLVGILLERSPLMVECILAIWKAGGAYIPIDSAYPASRIRDILSDANSVLLLTESKYNTEDFSAPTLELDKAAAEIAVEAADNLNLPIDVNNLAYVIYTSGSTGKPKGAMVEHLGMLNHMLAKIADLAMDEQSILVQNASHCFDISVWQFFTALTLGGQTVIYENALTLNPEEFISRVITDQVTVLEVVPSFLTVMIDFLEEKTVEFPVLQYLLVTGETLKPNLVQRWFALYPKIKLVNAYGPTEASDDITHLIMEQAPLLESIPVGKPLPNFHIYIVDKSMRLCPEGVKGEICVAGLGVGRGYVNDEQKTKAVFMFDPFVLKAGVRLYKTGDLGRWLPNGTVEFFGRKDYQVKIRGFRIELGEIESRLVEHPQITEAVVLDKEDTSGGKYLCAYLVTDGDLSPQAAKKYLQDRLPDYMVPAFFVTLDKMPLSPNGKINRKALPEVEFLPASDAAFTKPADAVEAGVLKIFAEVLGLETLSTTADFFEIGGHSLKAMTAAARIHREFGVELPLSQMFLTPTAQGIAHYLKTAKADGYSSIAPVAAQEYYPASASQKRLYLLRGLVGSGIEYNQPSAWIVEGNLDEKRLEKAIKTLIERHESLRTSFKLLDGSLVQIVHPAVDFAISRISGKEDIQALFNKFVRPFDLEAAPLLRVGLSEIGGNTVLLIDMHHIISDGVSEDILLREFMALYTGQTLPEVKLQYKDFAIWQTEFFSSERYKAEEAFWLKEFAGQIPILALPTDYPRTMSSTEGGWASTMLDATATAGLNQLAAKTGSTMYMVLLAALNTLLYRYTGQEDIVVGTPTAGRQHADLENVIGVFINTLAIRNYPQGEKTFIAFLTELKLKTLQVYENQDYQFDLLVDKLKIERDLSRNPLFDVILNLVKAESAGLAQETTEFTLKPAGAKFTTARVDFKFDAVEVNGQLLISVEYKASLYKRESIQRMLNNFCKILRDVAQNSSLKLKDIELLGELQDVEKVTLNDVEFVF